MGLYVGQRWLCVAVRCVGDRMLALTRRDEDGYALGNRPQAAARISASLRLARTASGLQAALPWQGERHRRRASAGDLAQGDRRSNRRHPPTFVAGGVPGNNAGAQSSDDFGQHNSLRLAKRLRRQPALGCLGVEAGASRIQLLPSPCRPTGTQGR